MKKNRIPGVFCALRVMTCAALFFLSGCRKAGEREPVIPATIEYSFFVAGHTYGKPGVDNVGLHPPFVAKFDQLREDPTIQFGILTGDIVWHASENDWNEVDVQLQALEMPVYFAAGNHDVWDRPLYESRYGNTYYSFVYNDDVFVVLDPNFENWNISAVQLEFLQQVLHEQVDFGDNLFIFFHQLLWWEPDNVYKNVQANSFADRADTINFWSAVEPLFNDLPNKVFMLCGDVGAHPTGDEFMYHQFENITLIASGMGGGIRDNFVIADVWSDGSVTFRLIALNTPGIDDLGKLEDYELE